MDTIESRERLKGFFKRGTYPTEAQFAALIDSMAHRGDTVGIDRVAGLSKALNDKISRGEAGALRELLDGFRGFGVLPFDGFEEGAVALEPGAPGRVELLLAASGGGLRVVYSQAAGQFVLELAVGSTVKRYGYWVEIEGAYGRIVEGSAEYRRGRVFTTRDGEYTAFYTWEGDGGPRRAGDLEDVLARVGALAESLAEVAGRLNELPVRDFDGIDGALRLPNSDSAGEVSPLGTTVSVVYSTTCRQFFLKVVPHQVANTAYYGVWGEIVSSTGKLLAAPSSEYQQVSDVDGSAHVLAGRLFHLKAEGSPARFYAWDGEQLRMVNSFAGQIRTLSQGLADAASELGLAQSKLARHDERLEELDEAVEVLEQSKLALFDDMWRQAWGSSGGIDAAAEDGRRYLGNGLRMTYAEALAVMDEGALTNQNTQARYAFCKIRTALPPKIRYSVAEGHLTFNSSSVEVIDCSYLIPTSSCFQNCVKLKEITHIFSPNGEGAGKNNLTYAGCTELREIKDIRRVHPYDFSLGDCPLISYDTLALIVAKKSASTGSMVITLHADTYAKVCGDTSNEAAAALSAEELGRWTALPAAAGAKNITFALA